MKKHYNQLLILMAAMLILSSCGTSTQILGVWQKPDSRSIRYQKVLVASLTNNLSAQQKVETELATILSGPGVVVTKSLDVFPPSIESKRDKDKDALLKKLRGYDSDIIVTNTVVDKKLRESYNRPFYGPWAWGGWGGWGGWGYRGWGGGFYDPGFAVMDKEYYLETNVFDSRSGELVWSVQTRTSNPSSLEKFIEDYAKVIAKKMIEDGIIKQY